MAKGNPNDASMHLNFVAKVYDPTAKAYKPIYVAPDATSTKRGEVWLSDATNGTDSAATGVVAATPAAVKAANDNANNKLDKITSGAQTVAGSVTFNNTVTGKNGFAGNLTGSVTGNASTATKLANARSFSIKAGTNGGAGTGNFDGSGNVSIIIPSVDAAAVNVGTLPLSVIPQGALERLVHVTNQAARFALTTSTVQLGDSVIQDDTGVMYIVVDQTKLNQAAGYQEYKAGTALNANHASTADTATKASTADSATTATTAVTAVTANKVANAVTIKYTESSNNGTAADKATISYDGSSIQSITIPDHIYSAFGAATASASGHLGLVPAPAAGANTKFLRGDGTWQVAGEVTGVKGDSETNYRKGNVNITSANIGALALSGGTLTGTVNSQNINPSANNAYSLGNTNYRYANIYATNFIGNLTGNVTGTASNATVAQTANKFNNTVALAGDVTAASTSFNTTSAISINTTIGTGKVTETKIGGNAVTNAKIADNAVTSSKISNGNITSAKLADKAVTNAKLADDVGTVYVGTTQPTEEHIKIWVQL